MEEITGFSLLQCQTININIILVVSKVEDALNRNETNPSEINTVLHKYCYRKVEIQTS